MPDEFDTESQDSGNEDPFDSSTADGSEAEFLGTDGSQSDDHGATPPDEEGLSKDASSFLDEGDRALLYQDIDRGYENIVEKAGKFAASQNKTFTKRMQRIAAERSAIQPKATAYDALDHKLAEIRNSGPEGSAYVDQFLSLIKGERDVGTNPQPKKAEPKTVAELTTHIMDEVKQVIRQEVGGLKGEYSQDQATREVDDFLKRANNPKLNAIRDKIIETMAQNPGYKLKQALATTDPDLFAELTYQARKRREAPGGGARTVSNFTTSSAKPTIRSLDDALEQAVAEHGGIPAQ
jgi:hypothetical protein